MCLVNGACGMSKQEHELTFLSSGTQIFVFSDPTSESNSQSLDVKQKKSERFEHSECLETGRVEPYTSYPDAISYASLLQQSRKRRSGLRSKVNGREKRWPRLSSARLSKNRETCTPPRHLPFLPVPLPQTVGGAHTPGGDEFTPP